MFLSYSNSAFMKKIYTFLISLLCLGTVSAQLSVTGGYTAQQLAEILVGPGFTVTNATLTGDSVAAGVFDGTNSNIGATSGVILCTGDINIAVGPNDQSGASVSNGMPGIPELDAIAGVTTNDAVVLQFDFEVQTEFITFNYIFASEEYLEFVDAFNDVFAFWIAGPGISGWENIALIPNTTVPVTINNINDQDHWQYYVNNGDGTTPALNPTVQYDGFTTLLAAKKDGLIPCETYTLKLAIADALDYSLDSGVLLEENSLVQGEGEVDAYTNTVTPDNVALEGCIQASFTFSIDTIYSTPTVINFVIGGTAINGVDYAFIDSTMTIPAGQTEAYIIIDALADGIPEPQEVIELYFQPGPCMPIDTVFLYIDDAPPINFSLSGTNLACADDSSGIIDAAISGGFPPYSITLNNQYTFDSVPIYNLPADTYVVSIRDIYGCDAEAIVAGGIFDAGTTFLPDGTGVSYTSTINITGFSPTQTLTDINQFQSICANMEHSYANDLTIVLEAPDGTQVMLKDVGPTGGAYNTCDMGEPVASGPVDTWNSSNITPGIGYDYCWTSNPTYSTMGNEIQNNNVPQHTYVSTWGNILTDYYLPSGSYQSVQSLSGFLGVPLNGIWTLIVTDNYALDNGYIFNWSISLAADLPDSTVILEDPNPILINDSMTFATCGDTNGVIDITITGDNPPFTYNWSNGYTTEDINGISAGSYILTVADSNGCSNSSSFLVQNISSMVLSANISPVTCNGISDGSIDLTVTGGVTPYIFAWDNGASTEDISGLSAGSYTVSVTDSLGCISLETIAVTEPDALDISAVNISNEKCGEADGTIDIAVTGGTAPFSFLWSNGQTTEDIDSLTAGNYDVIVTDFNGCTAVDTFSIINEVGSCVVYCDININTIQVTDEICGDGSGAIDITVIDGTQPFLYTWSNGETTEDISGLNAGTYTINVKDAEGCEDDDTIVVSNNTGTLAIVNTIVTNETCGNGQGEIDNTISGGALPYTFLWSDGQTTEDATSLSSGNYSCTVTDANGCSISMNADVSNDAGTLVQTWGNAMDEICGNGQGSIDITISGGNPPYSYLWSNGPTTEDLMNLSAGTYTCTITDFDGCQITTLTYTINNDAGTLTIFDIDVVNETCGDGTGIINLDITGGTTPYNFIWNTGATTEDISGLSAGTYFCQIIDTNSCSVNTGNIEVFNSTGTLALDNIFVTDENCSNAQGSINILISGGTPPYTFAWSNGSNSEDLFGLSAGTYSCVITDTNGCTINVEATVNNIPGTLSLDNTIITNEICGNGQGAVNLLISGGTPPLTYAWSNGDTIEDISNLSAGTYTCQITDSNGCSITATANVMNDAGDLSLDNMIVTNEICDNSAGAIDITISGGALPYLFNWDNGDTTEDLSGLSAGIYSCQVTDNIGCIINVGPVTINNNSGGLTIDSVVVTNESCGNAGGAVDLTISGGTVPYTYAWNNGDTTEDISGLVAGTYTCQVSDANGCVVNTNADVLNDAGTLSIDNFTISDEVCGNGAGAIDLTISGGTLPYTFAWSNGDTTEDLSGLSTGTYFCVISDTNGCTVNTAPFNVANNPGTLSLDDVFVNNENCGDSSGYINITVSGGTIPYTFSWSNGSNTEDIYSLSAGTYSCQITDADGCTINLTANVLNDAGNITVTDSIITNEICFNGQGAIDITVSGGAPPLTYNWSNGATTQDISGLNAGNYTVIVIDINGCSASTSADILNLAATYDAINAVITDEICGDTSGSIDITVTGGTLPYTFNWSNGATTEDISGLSAGNYIVTVADANSCITDTSLTIEDSSGTLSMNIISIIDDSCGNGIGAINITASGGTQPFIYSWSNGETSEDINGLIAGEYTISVTDVSGCMANKTIEIKNISGDFAVSDITVTNEICGNGQGKIDITIAGGALPYSYIWSNGAITEDVGSLSSGTYSCIITDANGCSISTSEEVTNFSGTLTLTSENVLGEICGDGQGAIDITITGGIAPYTYSWSNGATSEDITGLNAGNYSCTITDNTACQISTPLYSVPNDPGTLSIIDINVINEICGNDSGAIDLTISGGTLPYSFAWNTGATTEDISGLSGGIYSCQITDANTCSLNTGVINLFNEAGTLTLDTVFVLDENCSNAQGTINITISGGTPPYSFAWSNGSTSEDLFGLSAGTYSCVITDTNGCTINTEATVNNIPGTLSLDNTIITNEICGNGQGAVNLLISGGTPPLTYAWSNGDTIEDISNLSAGTYTCQITDSNGCSITATANVMNDAGDLSLDNMIVTNEICDNSAGAIDITISGGALPYLFNWDNGDTTEDLSGLSAGIYSCQVTDNIGCIINVGPVSINNNSGGLIIDSIVVTNESCGNAGGAIDLTISGGTVPYTYAWSNGDSTEDISGLVAGTYTCQVSDANGCVVNTNVDVLNDAGTLSIDNFTISDEVCGNGAGAIDLTISGGTLPYTFAWSNGDTTEDLSGLSTGTYFCVISDTNGCTVNTAPFNVANNPGTLSLDDVFVNNENCGDSSGYINITVSGGTIPYTFSWSNGSNTEDIFGLGVGTYSCQITDADGCTINLTANVLNDAGNLTVTDSIITDEICFNGQGAIDISVSGGFPPYLFNWSNGDTTEDISGLSAGTYTCLITDTGGCSANHSVTIINIGENFTISGISINNELCGNGQGAINITVAGGAPPYTYLWSNGATTEDVSGLSAGNFSVNVTDTNSCNTSASATVQNYQGNINVSNIVITNDNCANSNGAIDITVSDGAFPYTYLWSNGATTEDISGLGAGNYSVIITDVIGCNTSASADILEFGAGYAITDVVITDEICGDGSGAIDITVAGGTPPYTFIWSNGDTTEDITGLSAGIYSISITDSLGCMKDTSVTVQNSSGTLLITTVIVTDDTCDDGNGAIDITVTGGTPPYTFNWSNGDTTEDITGLSAGTYTVTVTCSAGCVTSTSAVISNIATGYTVSNVIVTDELCSNTTGAIDITVSGGTPPYSFIWSNGSTTEDVSGLSAGNYTITVTDLNGCITDTSITVQNNPGTLSMDIADIINDNCSYGIGAVDITVSGGNTPYNFIWNNGATTEDISGLDTGTYTVIVTGSNGCIVTDSATIINPTGGPPLTSAVTGLTSVSEYDIENYSVAFHSGSIYYWTITGGNQISGGITNAISVYWGATGTGLLSVVETNSAGCIGDTISLVVDISSTGMNEFQVSGLKFKVYPNPNRGIFTLEIEGIAEIEGIRVLNILGQEIYQSAIINPQSQIDISGYPSGIYNLLIITRERVENVRIIIK